MIARTLLVNNLNFSCVILFVLDFAMPTTYLLCEEYLLKSAAALNNAVFDCLPLQSETPLNIHPVPGQKIKRGVLI